VVAGWWLPTAVELVVGIFANKPAFGATLFWWLLHLSSADHGGEGGGDYSVPLLLPRRPLGFFSLECRHGDREPLWLYSGELLRWENVVDAVVSGSPFNKCCVPGSRHCLRLQGMEALMPLLAGRGGKGERYCSEAWVMKPLLASRGGKGKRLFFATPSATWRWCCRLWIRCYCIFYGFSSSSRAGALRRELGFLE